MFLKVLIERCPQNHPCPSIGVCPSNALHQEGFAAPTVDHNACTTCGVCAKYCPMQALILVDEG
ncbi:MAG: 4Fe-4S binding protein [Raoultibacter sp.]